MGMLDRVFSLVRVNRKLIMGKNAQIVATSSTGAETVVDMTELAALGGVTASAAELNIMDGCTSTAAEINRATDISARVVTTTATVLALTVTQHAERVVLVNTNSTVANTFTLPVATGSGAKFTLIVNTPQTQGSIVVAASGTLDTLTGVARIVDTTAETAGAFLTTATDDKITLNATTKGGLGGDKIELLDGKANQWSIQADLSGSGTLETGFSAT